jgi:hypothetical protein
MKAPSSARGKRASLDDEAAVRAVEGFPGEKRSSVLTLGKFQ